MQKYEEIQRKLAEKERENTEKENFIIELQEIHVRKNQKLEKKALESDRRKRNSRPKIRKREATA